MKNISVNHNHIIKTSSFSLSLMLLLISGRSEAQLCQQECWYINGMAGTALSKGPEEREGFGRAGVGYHLNEHFDVGLAWSFINDSTAKNSSDEHGVEGYLRGYSSLDDGQTRLYLDAGVRNDIDQFMGGFGLLYALTPSLDLEVGYRYYNEPNSQEQGDVYSFGVGLQYNFRRSKPLVVKTAPSIASYEKPAVVAPVVQNKVISEQPSSDNLINNNNSCHYLITPRDLHDHSKKINVIKHTIEKNQWPLQIARDYCVELTVLEKMNPWLAERMKKSKLIYPNEVLSIPKINQ